MFAQEINPEGETEFSMKKWKQWWNGADTITKNICQPKFKYYDEFKIPSGKKVLISENILTKSSPKSQLMS